MRRSINVDENGLEVLGLGFYWNDVEPGYRYRTLGRTITEADITLFIGTVGMVEEMFTNLDYIASQSVIGSRPAPGSLVFCIAEGLLMQSTMQRTGMAFMEADVKVLRPTNAGDTVHVECEVVEARATSKPDRGLVRTANRVVNQRGDVVLTYNPLRMVKTRPQE
ncbi:acyl dehydratase [Achromobacter denitrificans]|uniref:FAS1-like dehydratase domain-containing protein n=1 Tax=Achromobacter TaxID=222 RepID=UPI000ABC9CA9|nr:MaoC family dehydratase N-terminal domain-containing protein [Achromobacter denitrificans]MDX3878780.1 MaoC family dehydratase N-terminal domain-containing protein [Achromobacter sp.]ASC65746.1 acyl dehydratase [Achromobacter denitrificans]MBV2158729.1 MaoC family dehydratase N-terminal domain-containing protein [Achromobacter denitrificans]MPT37460.1 acyl dehydratase [Achromobacter sp.]QCS63982.1 acyl dehydratase [Achromobacter denitrificans]